MSSRVRHPIGPVVQAPCVTTMRIRTRLRVSDAERAVIVALGTHIDGGPKSARVRPQWRWECGPSRAGS